MTEEFMSGTTLFNSCCVGVSVLESANWNKNG